MDMRNPETHGEQFDRWTRRAVGLFAGGLLATIAGVSGPRGADAKKKKRKKSQKQQQPQSPPPPLSPPPPPLSPLPPPPPVCTHLGGLCTPGQTLCCDNLLCIQIPVEKEEIDFTCCKGKGAACGGSGECCAGLALTCKSGVCQQDEV